VKRSSVAFSKDEILLPRLNVNAKGKYPCFVPVPGRRRITTRGKDLIGLKSAMPSESTLME